ncbi:MAG TPA: hypothetical protein VEA38_02635 [Terriglobales bacterium]|nr:hypothetical protein [Terriglobales bacterium]
MTDVAPGAWRHALDEAVAAGDRVSADALATIATAPPAALDAALRELADAHGAGALPVLLALGASAHGDARRGARRALYRLAQRGITPPAAPPARPVVERGEVKAVRAWLSAIDRRGARASWILFEDGFGGLELCSLIFNDTTGILEVAGGGITRKRLDAELTALRAAQKLPWLETAPARALALVAEAVALHRTHGTSPPAGFARWQRRLDVEVPPAPRPPADPDPALVARGHELLGEPETLGWSAAPADLQATRALWARRLLEMAMVFEATGRSPLAAIARAVAGALAAPDADVTALPFTEGLARRASESAGAA